MENHDTFLTTKVNEGKRFDGSVEGVRMQGDDVTGETGIMKRFVFVPNPEALKGKNDLEIRHIAEESLTPQLWKCCKELGWWPSEKYGQPYTITKQDDGSFVLASFLQDGKKPNAKFLSRKDKKEVIGVNEQ